MDFKIHRLGDSPKEAIYRISSGRKEFSFKQAIGELIANRDYEYEAAFKALEKVWTEAKDLQGEEVQISALNEETAKLFKYFRWYSDEKGAVSFYIKLSNKNEVYSLSRNLMESAQAVPRKGKDETVYAWMYRKYNRLVREKKLSFYGPVLGTKTMFPTLQFYWEKWAEQLWKADPDFCLPHTPKGISVDPKTPCFFFFNKKELKPGPTKAWTGWLSQFPALTRPVFRAWVFSIFDPKNSGRQAVWLHDNGYTGKSSAITAIAQYMGQDAAGSISGGSMKTNFAFEPLYGKRLVTYGDCKEPNIIRTPKIHSLLGNDYVTIDRKGLPAFTARLHAKLIVASNISPQIDFNSNNERTRLLYIPLREAREEILQKYCVVGKDGKVSRYTDGSPIVKGGNLTEELTKEMPHFIHECEADYHKLCSNGQDIIVTQKYLNLMKRHCVSEETLKFQALSKQYLEFGTTEEHFVPHSTMLKFYNGATTGNAFRNSGTSDFSRFRKYLQDVYGIVNKRKKGKFPKEIFWGVKLNSEGKDKADSWEEEK